MLQCVENRCVLDKKLKLSLEPCKLSGNC